MVSSLSLEKQAETRQTCQGWDRRDSQSFRLTDFETVITLRMSWTFSPQKHRGVQNSAYTGVRGFALPCLYGRKSLSLRWLHKCRYRKQYANWAGFPWALAHLPPSLNLVSKYLWKKAVATWHILYGVPDDLFIFLFVQPRAVT